MSGAGNGSMSRRELLMMIGAAAGSSVAYRAMASMDLVPESDYKGPIKLEGDPKGASVLILGAGLAGLVAALELRKAGYKVQLLEYNQRVGGRNWTLRGGDSYTELGGFEQKCEFDPGLYLNPGPWRLPYHHNAILDYCKRLGVTLEPFTQVNYNAYLHSSKAFGGKPQRYRHLQADFNGGVAELLAKSTKQKKLDQMVSKEDREILLESLKNWGALEKDYSYRMGLASSGRRGWAHDPNGGTIGMPEPSKPIALDQILKSGLWRYLVHGHIYEFQTTLFQPVGGMDMISKAFAREVGDLVRFNCKVTAIKQDAQKVTVSYVDSKAGGAPTQVSADWCLCTIPASVLSQIDLDASAPMHDAINALPYEASVKVGLQAKRRFWEQDESIYGGVTFTDLPNGMIGYPNTGYFGSGKGVLLGAYTFGPNAYEFTALPPQERVRKAIEFGAQIHPQYKDEIENGIAVGWHRVPWILGCAGAWTEEKRKLHYADICKIDGRLLLAGEHVSYIPAWQEGAITSSLNAISRLHQRVVNG
ncbi:MAG: flavin monoamine oxidase family protein [Nevskia sp.]|nr:flavin monoamine oxidase family protein [Nevskia sp.]